MTDRDRFEARWAAAYRRYLDEMPVEVDALAVARMAARTHPRSRLGARGSSIGRAPAVSWIILFVLIASVALATLLVAGSRHDPHPAVVAPTPTATPTVFGWPSPAAPTVELSPGDPSEASQPPTISATPLGTVSWVMWNPRWLSRAAWLPAQYPALATVDGVKNALPMGTDHGPVLLAGDNLMWRTDDGSWTWAQLPPDAYLPGASHGDELLLSGRHAAYRFVWSGGRWAAEGEISGTGAFNRPIDMAVGSDGRRVLLADDGVAVSQDGRRYDKAATDVCLLSVVADTEGYVGLGRRCTQPGGDVMKDTTPWTSADGFTWVPITSQSPFGKGASVVDVAARGGRQVAVGIAPPVTASDRALGNAIPALWISDNGIAWRRLPTVPDATCDPWDCGSDLSGFSSIAAGEAGWIALTTGGKAWTSADGTAWERLEEWPAVCAGYSAPTPAVGRDVVIVAATDCQRGAGDEVAIGTISDR